MQHRSLIDLLSNVMKGNPMNRLTNAFSGLASKPGFALIHRYQSRLNIEYQRTLCNLLLLRTACIPNEPNFPAPHTTVSWVSSEPVPPRTNTSAEIIELPTPDRDEPEDIAA